MPLRRSSTRRKLVAALLGLGAALLVAEIVCRIDALFPGKLYSPSAMRGYLESRVKATSYGDLIEFAAAPEGFDQDDHRLVADPWSGWTSPSQLRRITQGTRWFRGSEHEGVFDVVILGGSFGAQFGNANQVRLLDWLAQAPETGSRPIQVWNLSMAAHKQPAHLHRLTGVLALGWKPDLVLCIDGFNDLAVSADNALALVSPEYPSPSYWSGLARGSVVDAHALDLLLDLRAAQSRIAARAQLGLDLGVWRSALLSRLWSGWLSGQQAEFREARERFDAWSSGDGLQVAARGPIDPAEAPRQATIRSGIAAGLAAWADAARNLHAICTARGLPLVHAIQPALDDTGSKPPSKEEMRARGARTTWREAAELGYPHLRLQVAELAREGVLVRDGSRLFADRPETLYVDVCHLNDRGYELYGLQVVEWIRETLAPR